jgi:rhodanese-related sulfurtransferase
MSKILFLFLLFTLILCQNQKQYKQFTPEEIEKLVNDKSVFLIDTRNFQKILKKGIIPNSIVVSLRAKYNSTLTNLLDKNSKIVLITDKKRFNYTLNFTERLGFTNVLGYFMVNDWKKDFNKISKIKLTRRKLKEISKHYDLIDVRETKKQQKKGNLNKSLNMPLSQFKTSFNTIKKDKFNYFMSGKGSKSLTAISYLMREGYDNKKLFYVIGGYERAHQKLIRKKKRQDL